MRNCNTLHACVVLPGHPLENCYSCCGAERARRGCNKLALAHLQSQQGEMQTLPIHSAYSLMYLETCLLHLMNNLHNIWAVGCPPTFLRKDCCTPSIPFEKEKSVELCPHPPTWTGSAQGQLARTLGGEGGRKPSVGVECICCRPTHLFRIQFTSFAVTGPNVCVVSLKASYFAET